MNCRAFHLGVLACAACALLACNAIVGIDDPSLAAGEDGGPPLVDGALPMADGQAPPRDGGVLHDGAVPMPGVDADIADTWVADTWVKPPPPGKPGLDITAGGTWGKSAHFALVAAAGESPGGNRVGTSTSYTLKAGVIAVGQNK
jgi:hypothetical protein